MRAFLAALALAGALFSVMPGAAAGYADDSHQVAQAGAARDVLGSLHYCVASHYGVGDGYGGRRTASGERMNPHAMTAAHRTWPFGTRARVSFGGLSVVVRINDRGPFARGRCIDLSSGAARAIGLPGVGRVTIERM